MAYSKTGPNRTARAPEPIRCSSVKPPEVLRAERGWSQGDLADRAAVSRQTINAIETGKYEPSLSLAFRLAAIFEIPIESLFQPDPDPNRQNS
jgi:putative transcriptional regulator